MPSIYTTLSHVKMETPPGARPVPMMALSDVWRRKLDPKFVLGLGGLVEDPVKGLKCPFRDCLEWRHSLARHIRITHHTTVPELRLGLGLPASVGLTSTALHAKFSLAQPRIRARASLQALRRARGKGRGQQQSVSQRNARGACLAQLAEKLKTVATAVGHSPSRAEVISAGHHALVRQVERGFGTWNLAKQAIGAPARYRISGRVTRKLVLETFRAFERVHGRLPSQSEASHGTFTPIIPSANAVRRAMDAREWASVLRKVRAAGV